MFLGPCSTLLSSTARMTGLSRVPSQTGHGTSRMNPSSRSRLVSDSVSA